jgi:hypothetical protein
MDNGLPAAPARDFSSSRAHDACARRRASYQRLALMAHVFFLLTFNHH